MKRRSVFMYAEIGGFVFCWCGWILVCATLAIEQWTYSEIETLVLATGHYFSNLWKDCVTDSTGMSDCKDFPSLLALQMYIHLCRALTITSIILGFIGAILALVGMKCTKIGGNEIINGKITLAAGLIYLVSGFCAMFAYSWYGSKVVFEFNDPNYRAEKSELGGALFVGWAGATLLLVGGLIYSIFGGIEGCKSSKDLPTYTAYRAPASYIYAPSKRGYTPPPLSRADRSSIKSIRSSKTSIKTYSRDAYV